MTTGKLIVVLAVVLVTVRADFNLVVKFIDYSNPTGLCAECQTRLNEVSSADRLVPVCCDDMPFATDNCNNTGEARCDIRFRWIVRPFGTTLETRPDSDYNFTNCAMNRSTCPLSELSTEFEDGPTGFVGVAENPLPVPSRILLSWTGRVQFFIEAVDSSLPNIIDSLLVNLDNLQLGADFTEERMYSGYHNISHMTMSFRVECASGFCGEDCMTTMQNNPRLSRCETDGSLSCINPKLDPIDDCNSCLDEKLNIQNSCETCLNTDFDPETGCDTCLLLNFDENAGCIDCLPNYDSSSNCTECTFNRDINTNCTRCLPGWDVSSDCTVCLPGYGIDTSCTQCLPNRDLSTACTTCLLGWDVSSDCTACLPGYDIDTSCTQCLPNRDLSTACTTCLLGWDVSSDCTVCLPGYDIDTSCTQCLPNRDLSTACTTCLPGYDIDTSCTQCLPNRDLSTACTTCLPGWDANSDCLSCIPRRDPATRCSLCLQPKQFSDTDCNVCILSGRDPETLCTTCLLPNQDPEHDCDCISNHDPATDCSTCLPGWDSDYDCSACFTGRSISTNCTTCIPGYSGDACELEDDSQSSITLTAAFGAVIGVLVLLTLILVIVIIMLGCCFKRGRKVSYKIENPCIEPEYDRLELGQNGREDNRGQSYNGGNKPMEHSEEVNGTEKKAKEESHSIE